MAEDVQSLKVIGEGTVLELDTDKVPLVRSGTGTEFNGEGGSVIGQTLELGVVFCDLGHVEERDDGLVGGLDEQDLEGVAVERDALQSSEDGMHGGAASDYDKMNQKTPKRAGLPDAYRYRFRPYGSQRRSCPRAS